MATLSEVLDFFEYLFPSRLAVPDDRTGLQIKGKRNCINRIMVALELNREVFDTTLQKDIDFLYLHHPPLWSPLVCLSSDDPWCEMIGSLYHEGITVLAHHTNLDVCQHGIADQWVTLLRLTGSVHPLLISSPTTNLKIVTYVPPHFLESVTQAFFKADAGRIGQYASCSFLIEGTGTFLPLEGAHPFVGNSGQLEKVREVRIEITLSDPNRLSNVIETVKQCHPYEEPVIDVYTLSDTRTSSVGLGRLIRLTDPLTHEELNHRIQQVLPNLPLSCSSTTSWIGKPLHIIALCPGNGGSLIETVLDKKADAYITGDLDHHEIEKLKLHQVEYFSIPHADSERFALKQIFPFIKNQGREIFPDVTFYFEDEIID